MLTECFLKQTMYAKKEMPKHTAKKQMLNTVCQNTHAKTQMLKKCKHHLSSNQLTEKVMKDKKKIIRRK